MQRFAARLTSPVVLLGFFLTFLSGSLFAEALRNQPPGSYGWARAGGKIAHIDDASAVAINPANLTDVPESTLLFAPAFDYVKADITPSLGESASTKNNLHFLPAFFMSSSSSRNPDLTWGFGVSIPFGQATEFDEDYVFRYQAPHFTELVVVNFTPAVAYRVNDVVSIGAALNLSYSQLKLKQAFPWAAALGAPGLSDGDMRFNADGVGAGIDLGLTWDLNARNRLAFTFKSAIDIDYSGSFRISNLPAPAAAALGVTSKSDFDTNIKYPSIFTIGWGHEVNDRFKFGIDVEWVEWSNVKSLNLDIENNSVLFPSTEIPADWKDTMTVGFGFDYRLDHNSYIRGGFWFLENPIPSKTQQPYLPESDQKAYTIAYGFDRGPHRVEVSYGYVDYDERSVSDNLNPAFNGDYDKEAQIIALSWRYRQ
jgi:long-chain fatty acid transport protein